MVEESRGEIILYQREGRPALEVTFGDTSAWLTQAQMADLFQTTKQNISLHIKNIIEEGELEERATVKDYLTVQNEGSREVKRNIAYYSLDMIIAVGYRVKSFALRRMVNAFFDMAEMKAEMHEPMHMRDWVETLDKFSRDFGVGVLEDNGSVGHDQAVMKATEEYDIYRKQLTDELTDVEKAYLQTLREMELRLKAADTDDE